MAFWARVTEMHHENDTCNNGGGRDSTARRVPTFGADTGDTGLAGPDGGPLGLAVGAAGRVGLPGEPGAYRDGPGGGDHAAGVLRAVTDFLRGRKPNYAPQSAPLLPTAGPKVGSGASRAGGSSPMVTKQAAEPTPGDRGLHPAPVAGGAPQPCRSLPRRGRATITPANPGGPPVAPQHPARPCVYPSSPRFFPNPDFTKGTL